MAMMKAAIFVEPGRIVLDDKESELRFAIDWTLAADRWILALD